MRITLSEEEAHYLILKALNLADTAKLHKRGDLHILVSDHVIDLVSLPSCLAKPIASSDVPDDCYKTDEIDV